MSEISANLMELAQAVHRGVIPHITTYHPGPHYTVTDVSVDWNGDGDFKDQDDLADINKDGRYTVLHGHDDWSNLKFEKVLTTIPSPAAVEENLTKAFEPDHYHDFSIGADDMDR
jgi:hypothetical protein